MMLRLGFNRRWTEVVMKCVTTVRCQLKVNGEATKTIISDNSLCEVNKIISTYEACSGQV
jgi:hypothetical protein